MELTKEHFEQHLKKQLDEQTNELKAYARKQTEELASMVAEGFDDIRERLDVRERVQKLELDMSHIKEALHLTH